MADFTKPGHAAPIDWHAHFARLADEAERLKRPGETVLLWFAGETSDFIRFNAGRIRQTGRVLQGKLGVRLVGGARQASVTHTVCGDPAADLPELAEALATLRDSLRDAPDDPHLLFDTSSWQQSSRRTGRLPDPDALARIVADAARGLDFVGFHAGGALVRGFASSTGSRGWHEVENFDFSWSLYDPSGRAIKTVYAGDAWSDAVLAHKIEEAAARLPVLGRAPKALAPGRYRAYLAPAAVQEIVSLLGWDGFSARANASARSSLHRLHAGEAALDPRVTIAEDFSLGVAPAFNADGYRRDSVPLVVAGRSAGQLVSARTAREHGLNPNGATAYEVPETLSIAGGTLADADVLAALDTGLYVGNLWYLNFSDKMNCRMTGMTRFATFWVEGGRIVAPVDAMRFDDSLYRLLGDELEQLGAAPELLLNDQSWGERATGGAKLPGLLARSFELTL
ncbi:metallopeptidase TldD-related protein [Burkholderia oklahomensis]|uniref:metallopeptidase TldD-related protein n=1 Tax=Burkholderia oklahomensis TaxID=342113 RepID=UPI00016A758B|nr:metallopeptidase TldD-related protein [Burkholderia oklahomensis]AJX34808.1 modulator of DNA gyrase family protein [Burkholderia oklahomensis C6786]AOI50039.1 Zn-dependent protease [Burkholderia oklahomensis C6786]KUY53046.1 Zn-dependent protease [Burkholderia oklahomensis C6786]MBI0364081.1 TldD/PmbA family protein [Burkholderia oklahomensis]SUY28396.1 Predicted Zn-dependent proteases and their inactivated homologs [Burkholderia oklahomensis]